MTLNRNRVTLIRMKSLADRKFVKVRKVTPNAEVWIRPKWITAVTGEHCIIGHEKDRYIVFDDIATVGAEESGAKTYLLSRIHFCNPFGQPQATTMLVAHDPETLVQCIDKKLSSVPVHPCIGVIVNNFENSQ